MNKVTAMRGATTVNENTKEAISEASKDLIAQMMQRNCAIKKEDLISCQISTTKDITAFYPAAAIREAGFEFLPLFSCAEPDIEGSLKLCIRILLTANADEAFKASHVYLKNAVALRKDLLK